MIRTPFHDGWTVGPKLGAFEALAGAAAAQPVTLPHDAIRDLPRSAGSEQGVHSGYHPGGVFEYAKTFDVPEGWRDKTVVLEFEGVYRDAVVFVNGDFVVHEPNGYNAFSAVLDPFLRYGEPNRITVEAKAHKDSRWYSGAGIYRPVHLLVADPVHFALDGLRVTTPDIDADRAVVSIASTVDNDTRHTVTARIAWSIAGPDGAEIAATSAPVTILAGLVCDRAGSPRRACSGALAPRPSGAPRCAGDPSRRSGRRDRHGCRGLRHPSPAAGSAAGPPHQRRHGEAARRVRAPRQRPARRGLDRRRGGPAGASAQSGRIQRAAQRAQPDEPRDARCVRPPRRARDG